MSLEPDGSTILHGYRVKHSARRGFRDYFTVSYGKIGSRDIEGRQPVTVRVGHQGVFACLTCYKTDCVHAEVAQEHAEQLALTTPPEP